MDKFELNNTNDLPVIGAKMDEAKETEIFFRNDENKIVRSDDHRGIWNVDKKKLSTIASSRYAIIQHRDVIDALSNTLKNLNINVKGMIRQINDKMIGDVLFTDDKMTKLKDDSKEGIEIGFRFMNSYNKTSSFSMQLYGYRLVCMNGMVLGKAVQEFKLSMPHVGQDKLINEISKEIEIFVNQSIASSKILQKYINNCIADSFEWKATEKLIEKLLKRKKHRLAITHILEKNVGKGKKLTRWDFYNAFTEYATHNEQITPKVEELMQRRSQKILTTPMKILLQ